MMSSCSILRTTLTACAAAFVVTAYSAGLASAQAPAAAPATPGAQQAAPAATPKTDDKAVAAKRKTDCEHFTAILSGRKQSSALLDTAEVQTLARQVPELVACGAVLKDSDDICGKVFKGTSEDGTTSGFVPQGPYRACREAWSTFHEMRKYPNGRAFMFNDVNLQNCRGTKEIASYCDKIREVMRSGDANKCTEVKELESICRAYIAGDKALCIAPKGNDFFDKNGADLAKDCVQQLESKAPLAQGLKAVAKSGPAEWRELAKAALNEPDACAAYTKAAMDKCDVAPPTPVVPAAQPAAEPTKGPAQPADGEKTS